MTVWIRNSPRLIPSASLPKITSPAKSPRGSFAADKYNDAGFSGATTERPALQKLITDIKIGKIGCVVVYKVDRLSRSLLDFSKLLEFFDQNNVAFISVTQHFNTNSSMGRLTLNILLSFAQFEREIISERHARQNGRSAQERPMDGRTACFRL